MIIVEGIRALAGVVAVGGVMAVAAEGIQALVGAVVGAGTAAVERAVRQPA